jgi:CheY-like chemotaxis protein
MATRKGSDRVDVLIAEDDALTRQCLRALLEQQGLRCVEAGDGREALDLALRRPPRFVLLDVAMPLLDGFAVARALRADPRTRATRIHCVTGLADDQTRQQAREAGCERFLLKPVDPAELLEAVRVPAGPPLISGLTLAQAEELLDWLQNHGCTELDVAIEEQGVSVYGVCPPGARLSRDNSGAVRFLGPEPA